MQAAPSAPRLSPLPLPDGIAQTQTPVTACGLSFHLLEAGYSPAREKPLVLLLHGFPEMAYSWRKTMLPLARAGYYVVAVDQRGYGRTTGWDTSPYERVDLSQFTTTALVRDMCVLVAALGYHTVSCVVGHDFGAVASSMCALMRPDLFKSVVIMSHPFKPPARLPFNVAHEGETSSPRESVVGRDIQKDLASLPRPRKHYKWYNSTAPAAEDWNSPSQGLHEYLRGYFHLKSADWSANEPRKLREWSAEELAKMPEYYVMPLNATMPELVASNMAEEDSERTKKWLPDEQLDVYVKEWTRVGFQGGLNWYRGQTDPARLKDLDLFAGRKIDVPSIFISGESDWGNYQQPGVLESLPKSCSDFRGVKLIARAGHWPQQEQPERVTEEILGFLRSL